MRFSLIDTLLPLAIPILLLCADTSAQQQHSSQESSFTTPEDVVNGLYESVTFKAGAEPDWEKVRTLFIDQAVIILRTSRAKTTTFSVDGFVEDFIKFIERADVLKTGFSERIIRKKVMIYRDIAHVLVLYEATIPGSSRPAQQGVDSFQLIRKDDRWWIVAITNELPTSGDPVEHIEELRAVGLQPQLMIDDAKVESKGRDVALHITVKNQTKIRVDRAGLTLTLQRYERHRSVFKERRGVHLQPVSPGESSESVTHWDTGDWAPGTYYFYGHVDPPGCTSDSDFWDKFRTLTFDVGGSDESEERNSKE